MAKDDIVIRDSGINVSKTELENAIKYWPSLLRESAVSNSIARNNLLNQFMINRKIADEMMKVTEKNDPELYWKREFAVRNIQNKLYISHFKETLKVPDMTLLAKERIFLNKDKYLKKSEERQASHILLKCPPAVCDRVEKRKKATDILKKLESGENFESLVEKYSDDLGSKSRKGHLLRWVKRGEKKVDPYFVDAVFKIKEKGGYGIAETRFGLHIIRLDDIKKVSYKSEDEVLPLVIKELEREYKTLSERAFSAKLVLSEDAEIDEGIIDEILAKYKREKPPVPTGKRTMTIEKFTRP